MELPSHSHSTLLMNVLFQKCLHWTISVEKLLKKPELNTDDNISWSGYFTGFQSQTSSSIWNNAIIFKKSHSLAMIEHGMNVIGKTTELLHLEQFVIAKKIK